MSINTNFKSTERLNRPYSSPDMTEPATGLQEPLIRSNEQRIVPRSKAFHQSGGRIMVKREGAYVAKGLLWEDLYHTILAYSAWNTVIAYSLLYAVVTIVFALFFLLAKDQCGADWNSFSDAFNFSLITISTIGYGTTDPTWEECASIPILIFVETLLGIMMDALAIGLVFEKFSQASSRAAVVVFSDKACIRKKRDGRYHFVFQVTELGYHHLIQCHVSAFAVRHHMDIDGEMQYFVPTNMRIQVPHDEITEGMILGIPNTCSHVLGNHDDGVSLKMSPLLPPDVEFGDDGMDPMITEAELREYWKWSQMEIIAWVEGTDPLTGESIQARHSYIPSDIVWDHTFVSCVYPREKDGRCVVDFSKFHDLRPMGETLDRREREEETKKRSAELLQQRQKR